MARFPNLNLASALLLADTVRGYADHPSAYAIVGLEYFLLDQNLSMLGAPHSTQPWAHQVITMSKFTNL